MRSTLCVGVLLIASASMAEAQISPSERSAVAAAVRHALENLPSGHIASSTTASGLVIRARPTRTWKSTSGHFCRELHLRVHDHEHALLSRRGVHCRDDDSVWRSVD